MVVVLTNRTQKWPFVATDGFSAPTNPSSFNRQLFQVPLPTEKLGEQAGPAMCPEGQTLGPGRKITLLPPSPFYLAALPSLWEPSIPIQQQNLAKI